MVLRTRTKEMRNLFIALLALCGCSAIKPSSAPPNFRLISGTVYRGGQPTSPEQWRYLKSLGVKTVVKLNFDSEGSDDAAEVLGLRVVKFEAPPSTVLDWTDAMSVEQLNRVVETMSAGHCFVHCTHGKDRTGLACMAYRVKVNGWTRGRAWLEAKDLGYHGLFLGLDETWEAFK